jgi:hypothetical protein
MSQNDITYTDSPQIFGYKKLNDSIKEDVNMFYEEEEEEDEQDTKAINKKLKFNNSILKIDNFYQSKKIQDLERFNQFLVERLKEEIRNSKE